MSRKAKTPTEHPSVVEARNRSILDLAKVDEEENRRIKQMRTVTRGTRAFRAVRGAAASAASGSSGGSAFSPSGAGGTGAGSYQNQLSMLQQYMSGG